MDFPDRHQCGVFDHRSKKTAIDRGNSTGSASSSDTAQSTAYSDEEVPQKLDGEKCSIDEEVVLLRRIRTCVHQEQVILISISYVCTITYFLTPVIIFDCQTLPYRME